MGNPFQESCNQWVDQVRKPLKKEGMGAGTVMWFGEEKRGEVPFFSRESSPMLPEPYCVSLLDVFVTGLPAERDSGHVRSMRMISEFLRDGMISGRDFAVVGKVRALRTAARFAAWGRRPAWLLPAAVAFFAVLERHVHASKYCATGSGLLSYSSGGRRGVMGTWLAECWHQT